MQDAIHRFSPRLELLMRAGDVVGLWLAGHLASRLTFGSALSGAAPVHLILLYFGCALALILFANFNMYGSWRGRSLPTMFVQVAFSWSAVLTLTLLFGFLIHQIGALSRLWTAVWFLTGALYLLTSRTVAYALLHRLRERGLNSKRVLIIGYGSNGRQLMQRAHEQSWTGYDVKAVFSLNEHEVLQSGVERIPSLEDVPLYVEKHGVHEVWITLPLSETACLQRVQYLLRNALVDIRWVPDTMSMQILSSRMMHFLGMPAVDLNRPAAADFNAFAKDVFDKLFATVALFFLTPLFIVIATLIKTNSPGPVLFSQLRLGLNGRPFKCYKFRSMKIHEESGTVTQASKEDPRITPIGRFLRRTSLDELPQFFNVLLGDMSVVGPRPHALQHNELYKDKLELYMLRHRVKPGITGWAQIHGYRGETDTVDKMEKRVQFDLHYIRNWSFALDLKIIAWTALKGWTGSNAY